MSKTIGIVVAMEREACLQKQFDIVSEEKLCGAYFYTFFANKNKVVLAICGIGETMAAACTALLIYKYQVSEILNYGYVGSLDATLPLNLVVGVKDVVHSDVDLTAFGLKLGQYDGENKIEFIADGSLTEAVLGKGCTKVRLASADKFIAAAQKKLELKNNFCAALCDMEGAGIASVCSRSGIPFAMLKVVSDGVEEDCTNTFKKNSVYGIKPCVELICKYIERE